MRPTHELFEFSEACTFPNPNESCDLGAPQALQ